MRLGIIAFSLFVIMLTNCSSKRGAAELRELRIKKANLEIELLNLEVSAYRNPESVSEEK